MGARIRIGTRGSPLALAQAREVADRLAAAHADLAEAGAVATLAIRTTGDRVTARPLAEIGGKGLFTKEIDEALLDGRIDVAVHSLKDVPTELPAGIALAAVLTREDPRDALVTAAAPAPGSLAGLAAGSVVGTGSIRRRALVLNRRPDLVVVPFRGNVGTRLRKLADGEAAATLLALAGLRRLGLAGQVGTALSADEMLPAPCQGIVAIACRTHDAAVRARLAAIEDAPSARAAAAERSLLGSLDGSCRTPIAALAEDEDGALRLRALIVRPDGTGLLAAERRGDAADGAAMGRDAAAELRGRAGPEYFAEG